MQRPKRDIAMSGQFRTLAMFFFSSRIQSSNPTGASQIISRLKDNICNEKERRICCPLKGSEDLEEETIVEEQTDPGNFVHVLRQCISRRSVPRTDTLPDTLARNTDHQFGIHKMRRY